MIRSISVLLLASTVAFPVHAEDAATPSGVSDVPLGRGVLLNLGAKEKRADVALSTSHGGNSYRIRASAPLDEESRQAAFYSRSGGIASGFSATFAWEHSGEWDSLGVGAGTPDAYLLKKLCEETGASPCTSSNICGKVGGDAQANCSQYIDKRLVEMRGKAENRLAHKEVWSESLRSSFAYGLEAAVNYDTIETYHKEDLSLEPTSEAKYKALLGARFRYFAPGFALSARLGGAVKRDVSVRAVERCVQEESSDAKITAKSCKNVSVLKKTPEAQAAGEVRLAATWTFGHTLGDYLPGIEVSYAGEGIGQDTVSTAGVIFFVSDTSEGLTGLRTGVGALLSVPHSGDPDKKLTAWQARDFTPFAFIGSTFGS